MLQSRSLQTLTSFVVEVFLELDNRRSAAVIEAVNAVTDRLRLKTRV